MQMWMQPVRPSQRNLYVMAIMASVKGHTGLAGRLTWVREAGFLVSVTCSMCAQHVNLRGLSACELGP